jgi:hypothetical protein
MPLTFLAGPHGFLIFAPYAVFALTAHGLLRRRVRRVR